MAALDEPLLADGVGLLDIAVQEKIGQCSADCNRDDDRNGLDAAADACDETGRIDAVDVQQGEEKPVEQHARNKRDDCRNLQQHNGGIKGMASLQREDTQKCGADTGSGRLAHVKLQHADVAQTDRDARTCANHGQKPFGHVEHEAEPDGCDKGGDGMRQIDAVRCDGQ